MIKNYLKIAFRNLAKNKIYSLINILGLGLAIPFAMMSLMQLQASFEFDDFHPDPDRLYRIITNVETKEGQLEKYASSPYPLADKLRNNFACVEKATRVVRTYGWELGNNIKTLGVNSLYIEPSFFDLFGFELESGSKPVDANTLVISHETAERFFGISNPIGQVLNHPTYGDFEVTGVLKPFKRETQFRSDVMVSMASFNKLNANNSESTEWGEYNAHTFVKIQNNAKPEDLDLAIQTIAKNANVLLAPIKTSNTFRKQKISSISPSFEHLRSNPYVEDIQDIYFNFSIPLMILLLAGFNYTNLTLARSLSRAKEIGIRKVMGAVRWQLILQFISEAVIIALFSLVIGSIILQIMKQTIHVNWVTWEVENQVLLWVVFIGFALFLGLVAGILPSWILSGFKPVKVLKGEVSPASLGKISFRKSLIVIQFVTSLSFVFMIGHMYNQFRYMATENENFNRKNIVNLTLPNDNFGLISNDFSQISTIEKIGKTSTPFGNITTEMGIKNSDLEDFVLSYYYAADHNFIDNMELKFVSGQNLPLSISDSATNFVVINEMAVDRLHLGTPVEAIGKTIVLSNSSIVEVKGVVQNFCHFNYQNKIEPLVFQYNPSMFHVLTMKTREMANKDQLVSEIKTVWKKHNPTDEMVYSFFDEELYDRYYPAEDMKMMGLASLVIFVIALMGLLGIVIYSTEKRLKEVGIRKVLGATEWAVVRVLSWSFIKLILIACAVALPIGYFSGLFFQSVFTFHTNINLALMSFFLSIVFIISLVTIGFYVYRAAVTNPVKSLRSE